MQPFDTALALTPYAVGLGCACTVVAIVMGLREVACGLRAKSAAIRHLAGTTDPGLRSAVTAWDAAPGDLVAFESLVIEVKRVLSDLPADTQAWLAQGIDQWNRTGRTRYVAALVGPASPRRATMPGRR